MKTELKLNRPSVSFFRFPLVSHIQESPIAIFSVCLKCCPCNAFSFHSAFLSIFIHRLNSSLFLLRVSISLLAAIINRSSVWLIYLSSPNLARSIQSSTAINPRQPSFLGKYNLQALSLGCNALCIVIIFLIILSLVCNCSLVHSMKGAEYLNEEPASGTA